MPHPTDPSSSVLPEWDMSTWLNAPAPITLASLRGRVVLLHAFQMLCPGCVAHGLPQAERAELELAQRGGGAQRLARTGEQFVRGPWQGSLGGQRRRAR